MFTFVNEDSVRSYRASAPLPADDTRDTACRAPFSALFQDYWATGTPASGESTGSSKILSPSPLHGAVRPATCKEATPRASP